MGGEEFEPTAWIHAWRFGDDSQKFGFVQNPSSLCRAARREAECVVLGVEEQTLALCKEPTAFRTFYKEVEAAERELPPMYSPTDLPTHMTAFNTKLARALDKAIGLKCWKYLGPHVGRKHFLLMAEKCGGCYQNNPPSIPPLRPGFEGGWKQLWQTMTVDDLKRFCPDSGGHLDVSPAALPAERESLECGGAPPMMVSDWA